MRKACWCGRLQPCARHRSPSSRENWSPWRDRGEQAAFRAVVLARAGYRCEHTNRYGKRCPVTGARNLEAHHDGDRGQALCRAHHRKADAERRR